MTLQAKAIATHKLKLACDKLLEQYFPDLPPVGILLDGRGEVTQAAFFRGKNGIGSIIAVSESHYLYSRKTDINRTILHELIHYKLFHEGKRCGHTDEFKKIAWQLGLRSSSEYNWRWEYNCDICRRKYKTIRHWSKYKCWWCRKILEARPTKWWERFENEHKSTPVFSKLK